MGLNPEKNPAQTVIVLAQSLLVEIILSSFARPGLWPSESLGCSYTLRAWFSSLRGVRKLMVLTLSRAPAGHGALQMSPHPHLSSAIPTL